MRLAPAVLLAAFVAPALHAADIVAALGIDKVTVYRDSAIVTRSGRVEIPAGEHRLIVRGLSDHVDPATLRLSAASGALKLAGVEVQRIIEGDLVNPAERALTKKLRDLDDQKAAIQDEITSAQAQIKLLEGVIASPTGTGTNASAVPATSIPGLVGAVGTSDAAARARIRSARLQIRDVDAEVETTKAELAKIATARKATTELRVSITATAGGTVPVSLDYQMSGVSWNWEYEARLDSQAKKVALIRQAQLMQGTGEDWKDVELTISTARPGMNAVTPQIASAYLKFAPPRQYAGGGGEELDEIVVTGARRGSWRGSVRSSKAAGPDMSGVPEEASSATAEVIATDFVADYRIPGRVSVNADRQPRMYPINADELAVELVARAILPADRAAYLEAKLNYQGEVPIDAGDVQLYRDDAFVGLGSLPLVLPGAAVRIPFGQDDRIRIVVHDEREDSGNTAITKERVEQHKRRFEITSFHANALPIEVIDRIPVASEGDIKVEVLKGATPPTSRDFDGHPGVYLWRLTGEPRKTETVRHYYSVRFPRNRQLQQTESN
jgi:uncharacterized protein (TIGR02231 family)